MFRLYRCILAFAILFFGGYSIMQVFATTEENPFVLRLQSVLGYSPSSDISGFSEGLSKIPNPNTENILQKNPSSDYPTSLTFTGGELVGTVRIDSTKNILGEYYLTFPDGDVKRIAIGQEYILKNGYLDTTRTIPIRFPVREYGEYRLEFIDTDGYPAYNEPLSYARSFLLANVTNISDDAEMLSALNQIRKRLGREKLQSDALLQKIAITKANDMANHGYIGHISPSGETIRTIAEQYTDTSMILGENVAGGNVTIARLHTELLNSGSHRMNIVSPFWKKIGIGIVEKDAMTYVAQIFSE